MAKKDSRKRNGIVTCHLDPTHTFEWALAQMKEGKTVVREGWLSKMDGGHGRSETEFVALIPEQRHKPFDETQAEFLTEMTKNLFVPAYFVRGTILGQWEPGWTPTAKDMLATDWKLGFREYAIFCGNWQDKKKAS